MDAVRARHATTERGCLACHVNATANNNTTLTDRSFMFLEVQ